MPARSMKIAQADVFVNHLSSTPYVRSAEMDEHPDGAVVLVRAPGDAYGDLSSVAYEYGLRAAESDGPRRYRFVADDVAGAARGPASTL